MSVEGALGNGLFVFLDFVLGKFQAFVQYLGMQQAEYQEIKRSRHDDTHSEQQRQMGDGLCGHIGATHAAGRNQEEGQNVLHGLPDADVTQRDGDHLPYQQIEYGEDAVGNDHRGDAPMREEQDDAQLNDDLADGAIKIEA